MIYTDGTHLVATELVELHRFAKLIGLHTRWFKGHRKHPNYNLIGDRMQRLAIRKGAEKITDRQIVIMFQNDELEVPKLN